METKLKIGDPVMLTPFTRSRVILLGGDESLSPELKLPAFHFVRSLLYDVGCYEPWVVLDPPVLVHYRSAGNCVFLQCELEPVYPPVSCLTAPVEAMDVRANVLILEDKKLRMPVCDIRVTLSEAMDLAVNKWVQIVNWLERGIGFKDEGGTDTCMFCRMFYIRRCDGCPIYDRTGRSQCEGTPYGDFAHLLEQINGGEFEKGKERERAWQDLMNEAKKELRLLRSIRAQWRKERKEDLQRLKKRGKASRKKKKASKPKRKRSTRT